MRRDYFISVFLLCIFISSFYVAFLPLYFVYGGIESRDFGSAETLLSVIYALLLFPVLPVFAAYKRRFWITAGLSFYGIFAALPSWLLPKASELAAGDSANILSVIWVFILKFIYNLAEAPFAPLTRFTGNEFAQALPRRIMPVALITYFSFKIVRFYRDAYIAEKKDPLRVIDNTTMEMSGTAAGAGSRKVRRATVPEVLGTVISAPVSPEVKPSEEISPEN